MFFKILKKDIKRKKSMNIILILFMILIGMFVASSTNMLYTETTALDKFMEKSNSTDFIVVYNAKNDTNETINNWVKNNPLIEDYSNDETINIQSNDFILPKNCNAYDSDSMIVLTTQSQKHNLLYNHNDEYLEINDGEIAIPRSISDPTNLVIGDKITISLDGVSKEFTVKHFVKDATFGGKITGFGRIVLSKNDYDFYNQGPNIENVNVLSCMASKGSNYDDIAKDFAKADINNIIVSFTSKMVKLTYFPDLILAAIMMIVSIFLIFIAFLVLRFTIVFTLQEEYKEIGIMKAIGIKNKQISNIYLVKYLFISVIGSAIGFALSIPFSNQMLKLISKNILITKPASALILSILSVIIVILITLLFCKLCTRKINKFSAIDAIRNGTTGERFSKSKKINLHKRNHTRVPIFMAISDLINGWKRFIILIITFIFGTILILIPINLINTMDSSEMLQYFGMSESDVVIDFRNYEDTIITDNINTSLDNLTKVEKLYADNGVDVDLHIEAYYQSRIYSDDKNESQSITAMKGVNYSTDNYTYLDGTPPKLENEIAITQVIADYLEVDIGDIVHCAIGEKTSDFIVTALFQSMNTLGKSIRFPEKLNLDINNCGYFFFPGNLINSKDNNTSIEKMKEITPQYDIKSSKEFVSTVMGIVDKQFGPIKDVVVFLVLGINFLITILVVKMLVSKEISEIAILKSIGFKNKTIKHWQMLRLSIVLIISVIIGTVLANNFGDILISAVFKSFGISKMEQQIIPHQVYFLYPMLVIIITLLAVLVSLGQIKRTKVWEINNQE